MQLDQVPGVLRASAPAVIQVKIPKIKTRCHKLLADESDNDIVFGAITHLTSITFKTFLFMPVIG